MLAESRQQQKSTSKHLADKKITGREQGTANQSRGQPESHCLSFSGCTHQLRAKKNEPGITTPARTFFAALLLDG